MRRVPSPGSPAALCVTVSCTEGESWPAAGPTPRLQLHEEVRRVVASMIDKVIAAEAVAYRSTTLVCAEAAAQWVAQGHSAATAAQEHAPGGGTGPLFGTPWAPTAAVKVHPRTQTGHDTSIRPRGTTGMPLREGANTTEPTEQMGSARSRLQHGRENTMATASTLSTHAHGAQRTGTAEDGTKHGVAAGEDCDGVGDTRTNASICQQVQLTQQFPTNQCRRGHAPGLGAKRDTLPHPKVDNQNTRAEELSLDGAGELLRLNEKDAAQIRTQKEALEWVRKMELYAQRGPAPHVNPVPPHMVMPNDVATQLINDSGFCPGPRPVQFNPQESRWIFVETGEEAIMGAILRDQQQWGSGCAPTSNADQWMMISSMAALPCEWNRKMNDAGVHCIIKRRAGVLNRMHGIHFHFHEYAMVVRDAEGDVPRIVKALFHVLPIVYNPKGTASAFAGTTPGTTLGAPSTKVPSPLSDGHVPAPSFASTWMRSQAKESRASLENNDKFLVPPTAFAPCHDSSSTDRWYAAENVKQETPSLRVEAELQALKNQFLSKPHEFAADQARIAIWNKAQQRKLVGKACPMAKNLVKYLREHLGWEVYAELDEHVNIAQEFCLAGKKRDATPVPGTNVLRPRPLILRADLSPNTCALIAAAPKVDRHDDTDGNAGSHRALVRPKNIATGKMANTVDVYACTWSSCQYATPRRNSLIAHMCQHTGFFPHKCTWPQCPYATAQISALVDHMRQHSKIRRDWETARIAVAEDAKIRPHAHAELDLRPGALKILSELKSLRMAQERHLNMHKPQVAAESPAAEVGAAYGAGKRKESPGGMQLDSDAKKAKARTPVNVVTAVNMMRYEPFNGRTTSPLAHMATADDSANRDNRGPSTAGSENTDNNLLTKSVATTHGASKNASSALATKREQQVVTGMKHASGTSPSYSHTEGVEALMTNDGSKEVHEARDSDAVITVEL